MRREVRIVLVVGLCLMFAVAYGAAIGLDGSKPVDPGLTGRPMIVVYVTAAFLASILLAIPSGLIISARLNRQKRVKVERKPVQSVIVRSYVIDSVTGRVLRVYEETRDATAPAYNVEFSDRDAWAYAEPINDYPGSLGYE